MASIGPKSDDKARRALYGLTVCLDWVKCHAGSAKVEQLFPAAGHRESQVGSLRLHGTQCMAH